MMTDMTPTINAGGDSYAAALEENNRLRRELERIKDENKRLQNTVRNLQVQLESLEDATFVNTKVRKKARNGTW